MANKKKIEVELTPYVVQGNFLGSISKIIEANSPEEAQAKFISEFGAKLQENGDHEAYIEDAVIATSDNQDDVIYVDSMFALFTKDREGEDFKTFEVRTLDEFTKQ